MTIIVFDVLTYFEKLKAAGFTEQQSKVQAEQAKLEAEAISQVIDDKLATKSDILLIQKDIKTLEYKLTIRLGGMIMSSVAILGYLIKFGH